MTIFTQNNNTVYVNMPCDFACTSFKFFVLYQMNSACLHVFILSMRKLRPIKKSILLKIILSKQASGPSPESGASDA